MLPEVETHQTDSRDCGWRQVLVLWSMRGWKEITERGGGRNDVYSNPREEGRKNRQKWFDKYGVKVWEEKGRGDKKEVKLVKVWKSRGTVAVVDPHGPYIHKCHASVPCTEGAVPTQNRTLMRISGTRLRPHCLDSSFVTWLSGISSIYCFNMRSLNQTVYEAGITLDDFQISTTLKM